MADKLTTTESVKETEKVNESLKEKHEDQEDVVRGLQPKAGEFETAKPGSQQFEANNPPTDGQDVDADEPKKGPVKIVALQSQPYDVNGERGFVSEGQEYRVKKNVAEVLIEAGVARKV